MDNGGIMKVNVNNCARCELNHNGLEFDEFARHIQDKDGTAWTHWASCPTNKEPILLRVIYKLEDE